MSLREELKQIVISEGASLFGVADMSSYEREKSMLAPKMLDRLPRAVCSAMRLSGAILSEIDDRPTKLYFHHYRMVNGTLDRIGLRLTERLQKEGYQAMPIPASQIVDWDTQRAHLSHKRAAELAGLGWIGRNNLLVTPEYGSQIRLLTVLTDAPLDPDRASQQDCGPCRACIQVCPADSIKDSPNDFDHISCYEKLKEFRHKGYVGQFICGICVKACKGR